MANKIENSVTSTRSIFQFTRDAREHNIELKAMSPQVSKRWLRFICLNKHHAKRPASNRSCIVYRSSKSTHTNACDWKAKKKKKKKEKDQSRCDRGTASRVGRFWREKDALIDIHKCCFFSACLLVILKKKKTSNLCSRRSSCVLDKSHR